MAGKTGTAQVVGLNVGNGKGGAWKNRDHGHFICFAPFDAPRYACAVLVQHGGGSGAAFPIARDVMTYLFDQQKAWDVLLPLEAAWGGTPQQRMAAEYQSYAAKYGPNVPRVPDADAAVQQVEAADARAGTAPAPIESTAASPAPEPTAEVPPTVAPAAPAASPSPAVTASPGPAPLP
jgi:penicillin-binding protein 2